MGLNRELVKATCHEDILGFLAYDKHDIVRTAVAENTRDRSVLEFLSKDGSKIVRDAANYKLYFLIDSP